MYIAKLQINGQKTYLKHPFIFLCFVNEVIIIQTLRKLDNSPFIYITNNLLLNDISSLFQFSGFPLECSIFQCTLFNSSFLCGILRWINTISLTRLKHPNQLRVPVAFQNSIFPTVFKDKKCAWQD